MTTGKKLLKELQMATKDEDLKMEEATQQQAEEIGHLSYPY